MVLKDITPYVPAVLPKLGFPGPLWPSHSRASRRCPLSYVLKGACDLPQSPSNPSALLGILIHELLAWAGSMWREGVTIETAAAKFDDLVKDLDEQLKSSRTYANYFPIEKSEHKFGEKRHAAIARAVRPPARATRISITGEGRKANWREKSFSSKDGLIVGSMDYVRITESEISIVDYKSELFASSEDISPDYIEQLWLYAGLVHDYFGRCPDKMYVVDRSGRRFEIPFTEEAIITNFESAKRWVLGVKRYLEQAVQPSDYDNLASPSLDGCRFCACRPCCPAYWRSGLCSNVGPGSDLELEISSIREYAKAFLWEGQQGGVAVSIRLPSNIFQGSLSDCSVKVGDRVRMLNLSKLGNQYVVNERSCIYKLIMP